MKLLPALLASINGLERGLDPLQAISMAHGRVRNGFTLPKMDEITSQNERLLQQVFTDEIENRLVSLEDMVNRSTNLTSAFMKQGKCDSSFPTLDGSCNHPTEAGRSMQAYKETM